MEDKEILRYKDFVLRSSDLDLLEGPCFLNDQVIGFYFSYLSSICNRDDVLFVPPSVCFWLANCDSQSLKDAVEPLKLQTKRIVLFAVNDNEDLAGEESGSHWSTLIYDRSQNAFLHLDTMEGVNHDHALKLYDSVKDFIGKACLPSSAVKSTSLKSRNKKKEVAKQATTKLELAITAEPVFKEFGAPQQTNGYDCGVYVLAIAKAVCDCYSSLKTGIDADWLSAVQRHVDTSVEMTFRNEVMQLIEDLKKN